MKVFAALLASAAAAACAVGLAGAAPAPPHPCQLLTKALVEDYFNTDMQKVTDTAASCTWDARIPKSYKGSTLLLTTWRLASNAQQVIASACRPRKGIRQLSLPGAGKACGSEGATGLCVSAPKGEDPTDWCQWNVHISFIRGSTTGGLDLAALKI